MMVAPYLLWLKGDELLCEKGRNCCQADPTTGPFTDATLLSAMTGIARFVQDKTKRQPRATDGLGTEATRAGIIELLFKRGFLQRKGELSTRHQQESINSCFARYGDITRYDRSLGIQLTQIGGKQFKYPRFLWCH